MYNKLFTLSDLFHNKELKGVLPQKTRRKRYVTQRLQGWAGIELVDTCKRGAMPYMKNIHIEDGILALGVFGELRKHATIQQAYEGVLDAVKSYSSSLSLLGSYGDTIEETMDKIYKSDRYKIDKTEPKLYLRITSLNEIKYMNDKQKQALINNIVENIYFSDDFKEFREPSMERHSFIVNNRNVLRGYDSLKRDFDRKVRY